MSRENLEVSFSTNETSGHAQRERVKAAKESVVREVVEGLLIRILRCKIYVD